MQAHILNHLRQDPQLATVIQVTETPKVSLHSGDVYADLLRSVINQQLSNKAAATIHRRFLELFPAGAPDPETLLALDDAPLRAAGLSRSKVNYVRNVAEFFLEHRLNHHDWAAHSDADIMERLTRIKGVGKWTAEMILMFTLGRPDILPLDDLVIRSAMIRLYGVEEKGRALKDALTAIAEPWRPYRSYACYYLWPWYHRKPEGSGSSDR